MVSKTIFVRATYKKNRQTLVQIPNHCLDSSSSSTSICIKDCRIPIFWPFINSTNDTFYISFDGTACKKIKLDDSDIYNSSLYSNVSAKISAVLQDTYSSMKKTGDKTALARIVGNSDGIILTIRMPTGTTKMPKFFCNNSGLVPTGLTGIDVLNSELFSLLGGKRIVSPDNAVEMFKPVTKAKDGDTEGVITGDIGGDWCSVAGVDYLYSSYRTLRPRISLDEVYVHIYGGYEVKNVASDVLQVGGKVSEEAHSSTIIGRISLSNSLYSSDLDFVSNYMEQISHVNLNTGLTSFYIYFTDHNGVDLCEYAPDMVNDDQVDISLTVQYQSTPTTTGRQLRGDSGTKSLIFDSNRQVFI